jgi:glycosyltransferase involved in cell wall biosynthesis
MRIAIDMQGAQASNAQRGIGRYTLALTQALARARGDHELLLVLNGALADSIEPIRAAFDGLLPADAIRVWDCPGPVAAADPGNDWRRRSAELLREAFIASLDPDIVLVSSLFEGLGDDAVTSVGALGTLPTAVVLYDLIPLIRRQPYLENPAVENWYENKIGHLRRAALLLAISDSSRREGIEHLGFPAADCVSISTAADAHFKPQAIDAQSAGVLRERYGIKGPFVMYTGGIDHRKNIEGLIRAFALLPARLRASHQLAIVCSAQPAARAALVKLARQQGLAEDRLVLTGYVPEDDLVALYNLCELFVFPSFHEGFGLPALEAMSCGRAVIAAGTSSLPEVIGRADALFDPASDAAIAAKIEQVLGDPVLRADLERHGLEQAKRFSWDASARRALAALEAWQAARPQATPVPARLPRMAYVSPLPPARSGISDYSAELLPQLARHYEIDVIVAQDGVETPWIRANCGVRSVEWFRRHAQDYERVVYHFGNSEFHQHMFGLLAEVPGVVVLHDFFLSGLAAHMEVTGYQPGYWARVLYEGHGYAALAHRFHAADTADVVWAYPCNVDVLRGARGVIVHSENSRRLARQWYGPEAARNWAVVPHLRVPEPAADRAGARRTLGLDADDFVVCSFGLLGPSKLNDRLLSAWLASPLAKDPRCVLVFVGENRPSAYGLELVAAIRRSGLEKRIRITGWADTATFRHYLAAADAGVQLRTRSRGETSGTVLDCMNYALPTIVNANGSMADLRDDGVWKLADDFADRDLTAALETLWRDPQRRRALGEQARRIILDDHGPFLCAGLYHEAIEAAWRRAAGGLPALSAAVARLDGAPAQEQPWADLAQAAALSIPSALPRRQLLLDISELVQRDARSGIQRVVRSVLRELLDNPPPGYMVEPVYATHDQGYRYARKYTLRLLDCPDALYPDEPVEFHAGDMFLGLDLQPHVVAAQQAFYRHLRRIGVAVHFVVYDLLPVTLPQAFSPGAADHHNQWLAVVTEGDGAVCISEAVADELRAWMREHGKPRARPFRVASFHLGADIGSSAPSAGMPADGAAVLAQLRQRPTFLMVGTLEPRKGHLQALAAFEQLWADGVDANLVIVGKQGWMVEALVERMTRHAERNRRLFWLDGISDEFLEQVYAASACLIAASYGEGFGLPLIEAAQHKLPIVARDIPVFREVAGSHAHYFSGEAPAALAASLKEWLALHAAGQAVRSDAMPWLSWRESTRQLLSALALPLPS